MPIQKSLIAAQREASRRVAQARTVSIKVPVIGSVHVPPPERLAIYAALGGLAVVGLVDWPVALAMGVGSVIVARRLSEVQADEHELAEVIKRAAAPTRQAPAPAKTAPAKKAPAKKAPAKKAAAAKKAVVKKAAPVKKAAVKKAAPKKA